MEYRAICGSRSYDLSIDKSDYDVVLSSAVDVELPYDHSHNIKLSEDKFLKRLLLLENDAYFLQIWFPSEILNNTETARYILENRENILSANLDRIYSAYMKKANGLSTDLELWWQQFPKRPAYSCLFYDTLYRYATQDISFEEAFKPNEDFRQWLLAVRRNEIPKEEILLRNRELRNNAIKVAGNFMGKEDVSILNHTIQDMNEMLGTNVDNIKVKQK